MMIIYSIYWRRWKSPGRFQSRSLPPQKNNSTTAPNLWSWLTFLEIWTMQIQTNRRCMLWNRLGPGYTRRPCMRTSLSGVWVCAYLCMYDRFVIYMYFNLHIWDSSPLSQTLWSKDPPLAAGESTATHHTEYSVIYRSTPWCKVSLLYWTMSPCRYLSCCIRCLLGLRISFGLPALHVSLPYMSPCAACLLKLHISVAYHISPCTPCLLEFPCTTCLQRDTLSETTEAWRKLAL